MFVMHNCYSEVGKVQWQIPAHDVGLWKIFFFINNTLGDVYLTTREPNVYKVSSQQVDRQGPSWCQWCISSQRSEMPLTFAGHRFIKCKL